MKLVPERLVAGIALAFILAACGGGGDSTEPTDSDTTANSSDATPDSDSSGNETSTVDDDTMNGASDGTTETDDDGSDDSGTSEDNGTADDGTVNEDDASISEDDTSETEDSGEGVNEEADTDGDGSDNTDTDTEDENSSTDGSSDEADANESPEMEEENTDTTDDTDGSDSTDTNGRITRWRDALAESPSSDLSNREPQLEVLFELSSYEFVIELIDDLAAIENRIVGGEEGFVYLNVAEGGFVGSYLCPDGGRVLVGSEASGESGTFKFETCIFGDTVVNGLSIVGNTFSNSNGVPQRLSTANLGIALVETGYARAFDGLLIQNEYSFAEGSDMSSSLLGNYQEGFLPEDVFSIRYTNHNHAFGVEREGRDADEMGLAFLPGFSATLRKNEGPTWEFRNFNFLRADALDGKIDIGQITIDNDNDDETRLVIQADNGDLDSFDLFGFSSSVDVNSRVLNWSPALSIKFPRLFNPL